METKVCWEYLTMNEARHTIVDSTLGSIHLTDEEYSAYKKESLNLFLKYYEKERSARGIFASNQNRYVKNIDEFNQLDSKRTELLFQRWITNEKD